MMNLVFAYIGKEIFLEPEISNKLTGSSEDLTVCPYEGMAVATQLYSMTKEISAAGDWSKGERIVSKGERIVSKGEGIVSRERSSVKGRGHARINSCPLSVRCGRSRTAKRN